MYRALSATVGPYVLQSGGVDCSTAYINLLGDPAGHSSPSYILHIP